MANKVSQRAVRSKHELQKAESDALFHSIGEGAIVTDETGRISKINKAARKLLGFNERELLGEWYPGAIVAEDEDGQPIPNIERPMTKVFLSGETVNAKVYFRRKDNTRIAVQLNVSPLLLDGVPIGAIEVFRDITKDLELEKAKDEFISLASHQLRTPATGVKQYLGMILEGYAGKITQQQITMLKRAYDSNERQINIVNDLLRVARVDAGKVRIRKESIDIIQLTKDIVDEQSHKFKALNQHIVIRYKEKALYVPIDTQRMRMVIDNVIDNASKYTFQDKQITVSIFQKGDFAVLEVEDEGVGIRQKDLSKIFQKFSRSHNILSLSVGGTGLGLYWAKKIVNLHGGTITVSSIVDRGSCFKITIPMH